jgi:hypothetical protein
MPVTIHHEFIGVEKNLIFYSGKTIINRVHSFFTYNGDLFIFNPSNSAYINIYDERDNDGYLIKELQLNVSSSNEIFLNVQGSDIDLPVGKYYYEFVYIDNGGYEIILAFGEAKFI